MSQELTLRSDSSVVPRRPTVALPPTYHDVPFGDVEYTIVEFDVLERWVSFHHSLHWLLAKLLKNVDLLSEESLGRVGVASVRDLFYPHANRFPLAR
jgi:hypothetical protein